MNFDFICGMVERTISRVISQPSNSSTDVPGNQPHPSTASLAKAMRITRIVQVIGKNELSLYSYLDNVLEQHFATYQEEISELYKKRNSDIF